MKHGEVHLSCLTIAAILLAGLLCPLTRTAHATEPWTARVVSVEGNVEARLAGTTQWFPVKMNDSLGPGDSIRSHDGSRALVVLPNGVILRLDQNSAMTFSGVGEEKTTLLDLLRGAAYFFSRMRRVLAVTTPFVNGSVEGTEFFIRVEADQTRLTVFEGTVVATNREGTLTLAGGQSAVALRGRGPVLQMVVRPRDAVAWTLYYPPVLDERGAPSSLSGADSLILRAERLLSVGRTDEAERALDEALILDPASSGAYSLKAVMALVQNDKAGALELARKAVGLNPKSPAPWIALSYAQQAHFDLRSALASSEEAAKADPENPLAWSRVAELRLSLGFLGKAEEAANKAAALNPNLARSCAILGFAHLAQTRTADARASFEKAIRLDQADPLPRLGLGLTKIRDGALHEGRMDIEIAVSLDPQNALMRSYLGKAYFEEKRDDLAEGQYALAKNFDPQDPTPWFYGAILKQMQNRPVEAFKDLQKSVDLNDNRAVYRSRLFLDRDVAARSAGLGRIYGDLGFQQLALVEGWKSLTSDSGNYSAHRLLADSYSSLPRHEIARVSELLQSQLFQPLNITPVQPQLARANVFVLEGAGPADPALNEFNPLFLRNRLALQGSGVVGGNGTWGQEVIQSGLRGRFSYSLGQYHFETEGFRENNDLDQNAYNAFVQMSLSYKTSIQAELRYEDEEKGDLPLRFDPLDYTPSLRQEEESRTYRFGFHHAFAPGSDLIGSFLYKNADFDSGFGIDFIIPPPFPFLPPIQVEQDFRYTTEEDGYLAEVQHQFRSERFSMIAGIGYFDSDRKDVRTLESLQPPPPSTSTSATQRDINHTNFYLYSFLLYPEKVTWTLGASADLFDGFFVERDQVNPKFGVSWNPTPSTTLRGAAFRTLKRTLVSSQTVEPTQVAGFNQFFDDVDGTESWRYGAALDQKILSDLYGGVEVSRRDMDTYYEFTPTGDIRKADWEEDLCRAYLYWTPHSWFAVAMDYLYENLDRDDYGGIEGATRLKTHYVSPGLGIFHPSGIRLYLKATYVDQEGDFGSPAIGVPVVPGEDHFWVFDASIGYRLPRRHGFISIEGRNLFDKEFQFLDRDPAHSMICPERLILARLTLSF